MLETNPYKAYTDDSLLNSNPLGLVIALYEGAIETIGLAKQCLAAGDIAGRAKPINKTVNILTELMTSLDHQKGGEISRNLARLYSYMQRRVLDAHLKQKAAPLDEVEKLLKEMLDGWKQAGFKINVGVQSDASAIVPVPQPHGIPDTFAGAPYGNYLAEYADLYARQAYSF